jgi:hypothetical protein
VLQCSDSGIRLDGVSYCASGAVLARNFIFRTATAGISALGFAFPEMEISGNTINPQKGDGIVVGTGGARICDNRISNLDLAAADGIRLVQGLLPLALTSVLVRGNRFEGLLGDGVSIGTGLIEGDGFHAIQSNGIIMQAGSLRVSTNELINIAVTESTSEKSPEIAAIYLRGVFEGAVTDNAISGVGTNSPLAAVIAGVRVTSRRRKQNEHRGIKREKTVKTLAKRLLADSTKDTPKTTQSEMEAALLRLNPQLDKIGELDKGTPIVVPDGFALDDAESAAPTSSLGSNFLEQAEADLKGLQAMLKEQATQPTTQSDQVQAWLGSDQAKALIKETPALKAAFSSAATAAKALPKEQAAIASAQNKALAKIQTQLAAFRKQNAS